MNGLTRQDIWGASQLNAPAFLYFQMMIMMEVIFSKYGTVGAPYVIAKLLQTQAGYGKDE